MTLTTLKTKPTDVIVKDFLSSLPDEKQREDAFVLFNLMKKASGEKPKMWGSAIIGYGAETLKYDSGREIDWMRIGFSPRKGKFALYGLKHDVKLLSKLGTYKAGAGCLYIKKLADVNSSVLKDLITFSVKNSSTIKK